MSSILKSVLSQHAQIWTFNAKFKVNVQRPPSHLHSPNIKFLLLYPGQSCHWFGDEHCHFQNVFRWPSRWWLHWLSRSVLAPLWQGAACPLCRPVSKSWRRGGRRRCRISKLGGSRGEPGSRTFPWSSTGWCEWKPEWTASEKWQQT